MKKLVWKNCGSSISKALLSIILSSVYICKLEGYGALLGLKLSGRMVFDLARGNACMHKLQECLFVNGANLSEVF